MGFALLEQEPPITLEKNIYLWLLRNPPSTHPLPLNDSNQQLLLKEKRQCGITKIK